MGLNETYTIKPIKKTSVVEQAIERIYDLVKNQNLKAGDKLPAERELSEALLISRSSLREAIRVLDMMGIVKVEHGQGMVLDDSKLSMSVLRPLAFMIASNKEKLLELYEFRKMIEVECTRQAAIKATEEDLANLKDVFTRLVDNYHNRDLAIDLEIAFHEAIAKSAGNSILSGVLISIHDIMKISRDSTVPVLGISEETIEFHKKILKAIEDKNPEDAAKYMQMHVESVYKRIS